MSNELAGRQSKLAGPSSVSVGRDPWRCWSCDQAQLYHRRWSYPSRTPCVRKSRWCRQNRDRRHLGLQEPASRSWLPFSCRHVSSQTGKQKFTGPPRMTESTVQYSKGSRQHLLTRSQERGGGDGFIRAHSISLGGRDLRRTQFTRCRRLELPTTVANRRKRSARVYCHPDYHTGASAVVGVYSRALATRAGGETEGRRRVESRAERGTIDSRENEVARNGRIEWGSGGLWRLRKVHATCDKKMPQRFFGALGTGVERRHRFGCGEQAREQQRATTVISRRREGRILGVRRSETRGERKRRRWEW